MDQAAYEQLAAEVQARFGPRIARLFAEADEWARMALPDEPGIPFLVRLAVAVHALAPYVDALSAELEAALATEGRTTHLDAAWHGYLIGAGSSLLAALDCTASSVAAMVEVDEVVLGEDSRPPEADGLPSRGTEAPRRSAPRSRPNRHNQAAHPARGGRRGSRKRRRRPS